MKLTRQHSPIKYCGSGVYKIKRFAAYNNYQELEEQREYAVNPFTSGARFIQSMRNQRASGKGWVDSFKIARNRNAIASAEREARVARDAVNANSRGLEVAQSNQATLKPLAETSGDIANVNAYNKNKETIKKLTNEQPDLDKQLENRLKEVENLRNSNKDLGSGVKDVNVTAKRRAAQEEVGRQLQAEEEAAARAAKAQQEAAKAQKPWDERRAAQEKVGKQLQAEEEAAKRAQQQPKPTNPEPQPQTQTQQTQQQTNTQQTQTQTQQQTPTNTQTPTQPQEEKGWYDGLSGWGKAGVLGGATAGISGLTYLGYNALSNNNKEKE